MPTVIKLILTGLAICFLSIIFGIYNSGNYGYEYKSVVNKICELGVVLGLSLSVISGIVFVWPR